MKLLVCVIIALLQLEALCAPASDKSSLPETDDNISVTQGAEASGSIRELYSEDGAVPLSDPQTPPDPVKDSQVSHSRVQRAVGQNLQWVKWNNQVPSEAISIYNDYAGRTDYVCRSGCNSGFYSKIKGPYCYFTCDGTECRSSSFDLLVKVSNSGDVKWVEGSFGSMSWDAVRTCPEKNVYVGKNKYGLGKIDHENRGFFLPWEGSEYWYWYYQILTYKHA